MLNKCVSILTTVIAFKTGSLCALMHLEADQCTHWGVEAEGLYWMPDVDNTDFVINSSQAGLVHGTIENNQFRFTSGFRVEGVYAKDCLSNFHLRYARLRTNKEKTVTGDHLWELQGGLGQQGIPDRLDDYNGFATSELDLHFHNAEILYSRQFFDKCQVSKFHLFSGLQYYYFSLKENYSYVETVGGIDTSFVNRSNKNYGIGPELGLEFAIPINMFMLWCGTGNHHLSLVGQASGSLLTTHSHEKHSNTTNGLQIENVNSEPHWRIVPAWNARAGFHYASTCRCVNYSIEIGYELTSYLRGLSKLAAPFGAALYEVEYYNLDLQGLYIALGLIF